MTGSVGVGRLPSTEYHFSIIYGLVSYTVKVSYKFSQLEVPTLINGFFHFSKSFPSILREEK